MPTATGPLQIARKLEQLGADYLAVSSLDEARELRHGGIHHAHSDSGAHAAGDGAAAHLHYGITQAVSARAKAEEYSAEAVRCGGTLKVHIKVDTGMSRLGFLVRGEHFDGGVDAIAAACRPAGAGCGGDFHPLRRLGYGRDRTARPTPGSSSAYLPGCWTALAARGCTFRIRHCANSGALTRYPEMYLDMVRPGIAALRRGGRRGAAGAAAGDDG